MWRGPGGRGRGVVVGEAAVLQRREVAVLIDVGPPSRQERREVAGHELHEGPAQRDGDQTDDHVGEAPDRDDAHGELSDQEKSVPPTSYGSPPKVGSQSQVRTSSPQRHRVGVDVENQSSGSMPPATPPSRAIRRAAARSASTSSVRVAGSTDTNRAVPERSPWTTAPCRSVFTPSSPGRRSSWSLRTGSQPSAWCWRSPCARVGCCAAG